MHIIQLSAECYPVAKAGGLGDVVGALPKYLAKKKGVKSWVVMPKYHNEWMSNHRFKTVFEGEAPLGNDFFHYSIEEEVEQTLGFPLYVINIPGRFDRPGIYIDPSSGYAYWDELERFMSFQIAALEWLKNFSDKPDVIHCHDHHAGLVPFMMTNCFRFNELESIPTVLTVHNGQYHGEHDMQKYGLLPAFDLNNIGLLEWNNKLCSLAAGVKCAWKVTTVSPSYMDELMHNSNGMEWLFQHESQKCEGIINGIDVNVWDPDSDPLVDHHFSVDSFKKGKADNKKVLCERFGLNPDLPLFSFIGRLVKEKGADLLPDLIKHFLNNNQKVNFVILGTGDPALHDIFNQMRSNYMGFFDASLEYNEKLAHQIYAGSDFIMMPSRVEPCGLNQMYAMRYGSIPVVRSVGGLKDTIVDLNEKDGYGIRFDDFTLEAAINAIDRGRELYEDQSLFDSVRKKIMELDFSWNASASHYIEMYTALIES